MWGSQTWLDLGIFGSSPGGYYVQLRLRAPAIYTLAIRVLFAAGAHGEGRRDIYA